MNFSEENFISEASGTYPIKLEVLSSKDNSIGTLSDFVKETESWSTKLLLFSELLGQFLGFLLCFALERLLPVGGPPGEHLSASYPRKSLGFID
jgi:hypothetical protein